MAGFFTKRIIGIEVAGQSIELYPISIGHLPNAIKVAKNFESVSSSNDVNELKEVVDQMCRLIKDNSNIPDISDVLELNMTDIGFVFGSLVRESQDPKVSAPIGATKSIKSLKR